MFLSFSLQLNTLSGENKRLRRQLEDERSMRREVERLLPPPPTSQQCSSVHLPLSLSARPPPPSTSLPSSLHLPHPLSLDTATGHTDGILTQTKLRLERPGESQALGEAFWIRPSAPASLEDAWSERTSRDLTKWSPLKTLTCHDFLTPQLLTRECTQYEVNVLQVKVKSQGAFCLRGAPEPADDGISSNRQKSTQKYLHYDAMRTFILKA